MRLLRRLVRLGFATALLGFLVWAVLQVLAPEWSASRFVAAVLVCLALALFAPRRMPRWWWDIVLGRTER